MKVSVYEKGKERENRWWAKETTKAMKAATDECKTRAKQRSSEICPRLISPLTEMCHWDKVKLPPTPKPVSIHQLSDGVTVGASGAGKQQRTGCFGGVVDHGLSERLVFSPSPPEFSQICLRVGSWPLKPTCLSSTAISSAAFKPSVSYQW